MHKCYGDGCAPLYDWPNCLAYLEEKCNPAPGSFPEPSKLYALVLWQLAECIQARSVLEVGIGPTAVSGSTFIHNMAQRGGGFLCSVDIDPNLPRAQDKQLARDNGVVWTVLHGDSLEVAKSIPATLQVDLLYIDGDHDYAHAYGDTRAYLPFLRPGGYLVIDDFPTFEGVVQAMQQLQAEGFVFIHMAHETPHGNGRLVWQKPAMNERALIQHNRLTWEEAS